MSGDLRLILFGCDGTLVDSVQFIHEAIVDAWENAGLEPPAATLARRVIGMPLRQAIAELAPDQTRPRRMP